MLSPLCGLVAAFVTSIMVFCLLQTLEPHLDRPLFILPGIEPYEKDLGRKKADETTHALDMSGYSKPVQRGEKPVLDDGEKPVSNEENSSDDKMEVPVIEEQ